MIKSNYPFNDFLGGGLREDRGIYIYINFRDVDIPLVPNGEREDGLLQK